MTLGHHYAHSQSPSPNSADGYSPQVGSSFFSDTLTLALIMKVLKHLNKKAVYNLRNHTHTHTFVNATLIGIDNNRLHPSGHPSSQQTIDR